jgi:DNA-directed RNA polymerase subunit M/transcription elongation factor TFIIS
MKFCQRVLKILFPQQEKERMDCRHLLHYAEASVEHLQRHIKELEKKNVSLPVSRD